MIRFLLSAILALCFFSAKAQYSGNALDFDGSNDMVVSSTVPSFFSSPGSNDFTIEAWVYPRGSAFQRIFFAQPNTSNFVSLGTGSGNVIYFYVINGGVTYSVATTTSIPTNTWSHIAARWTSATNTPEVFFNGTVQSAVGGGSSSTGTDGLMVLGSRPGGAQFFSGSIDELRVWGAARTDCEIVSNMNNSFTVAQTNLAVNYHFNHGTAAGTNTGITTLSDISGNAYNGTLNNFALSGTTSNWISSGASITTSGNTLGGPLMTAVDNQTVCNNESVTAITFASSIPSATYSWTNDNTATGLAASGSGDIASFTGTNNTSSPISSRVIVTPSAGGCSGVPDTFYIQVNPTPTIVATGDQVLCNNSSTTAINFSGSVGNDYSWTNNKTSIGLAASGTGNISAFTATNTGTSPDTAIIIVTPSITSPSNVGTVIDSFVYTGSLQNFTVPTGVTSVKITAAGAQGGTASSGNYPGGKGAKMTGTFTVAPGDVLDIVVGGKGNDEVYSTGGGGGSGVNNGSTALVVAGGGAGIDFQDPNYAGIHAVTTTSGVDGNSNGGSGGTAGGNGGDYAYTPTNISRGGNGWNIGSTGSTGANGTSSNTAFTNGTWGLGGGGGSVGMGWCNCGGGGGGYSGGGSANINRSGGGGGSYNSGTAQTNIAGTNTGNGYVLIEYAASITCTGTPDTFAVVVKPTPTVAATSDQSVCNGAATAAITFAGAVTGTTYNWTNNNTSIGLAASGSGNIASFSAVNNTSSTVTARIIVTPTANGCPGIPDTFNITVKPTPTVNAVSNQTLCNGAATTAISFSGAVTGTTYNWTNNTTSIGLAASGSGDIASFTAANAGTSNVTGTITVTPTANGCSGTAISPTITVKPTPTVNAVSNQSVCNGAATTAITFGSGVTGTTYAWTNNTTSIGLAASGSGDIASFTATNTVTSNVTGIITVTPTANSCTGPAITPTITVKPTPTVNAVSNQTLCNGASTTTISFSGAVTGTTYNWTNNTTSIGLAASGSGDIGSFTAANAGTSNVTGTITITPTANGCSGTAISPTITVKPSPTVNAVSNQSVCNGAATTAITFGSGVTGTTYAWTNNTTSIGLAASGSGDIASFTATSTGTSNITGTITVTPTANGCTGPTITPTITVKPTPTVNAVSNQTLCNGAATTAISFSGAVTGTTYNWTNNTTSIGLAASGSGDIASFTGANSGTANVTGTITVTPTASGCSGTAITPTITVKPSPTVNAVSNQSVCNGAATTAITFGSPVTGTTYAWTNNTTSIGLAASGSGDIASFTATNTGTSNVTGTITVTPTANGCTGPAITPTITVKPTPTVNAVSNQTLCNGAATTAISFSGAVTGTTYNWTNNTTSIGLAASGTGNIASFTAVNSGTSNVTGTITVTPTANGCSGTAISPTITVKPSPTVNAVSNQSVCNGAATTAIAFGSSVTGTTYAWTNNTTSIGLAASGSGDIASFTATNTGTSNVTGTITVTPTANGCQGPAITPTITVKPTPTMNAVSNQTLCNGASTTTISFSGAVTGTTYNWTNNTTSIGLAASGTGDITSFAATNTTAAPVTATITVTPVATSCSGTAGTFTILVNPTPKVNTIADMFVCNGTASGDIIFSSATSGTTYTWTNSNTAIGLAASGSGDIASFTGINTGTSPVTATISVIPTANGCTGPAKSFDITINPTEVPTISITSSAPANTICIHTNVTFTAAVTFEGNNPVYQWKKNGVDVGTNSSVYNDNHLADGDVITCDLMSSVACPSSPVVTSNAITTNVNMYVYHTIDISSDKQGDTLCAGEVVNFSSVITNGGSSPIYQWMKNGFNVGTNSPTYTDAAIRDRDVVTCSLTTNVLCPAASTITNSNRVIMHSMNNVTASVVIIGVYTGSTYVFHSQTTNCGNNPSYQWMLNNTPIAGATHDSLWISDLRETDRIKLVVIPDRRCTNNATASSNNLSKAQVTGVEDVRIIDKLTLVPNPNNGNFMIEGQVNGLLQLKDADLVVTNAVGQVMYRTKVDVRDGQIKAELQLKSVLVSGIYHLSILSNGQKYNARFVVVGD